MTRPSIYVVDASVFIQAKQRYYAFDVCPGFWEAIEAHCGTGVVCSIDRIKAELDRGKDELTGWANRPAFVPYFVRSDSSAVLYWYAEMQKWANAEAQYTAMAKAEFAETTNADPWIIAYAKVNDYIVATQEVRDPLVHKRIPIPNACEAFGVRWENTFDMLRALTTSFVCAS